MKKLRKDLLLLLVVILAVVVSAVWLWQRHHPTTEVTQIYQLEAMADVPLLDQPSVSPWDDPILASLSAQSLVAMDVNSGSVLLEKNASQSAYPASTTKLMTALIASQIFDPDQELVIAERDLVNGNKLEFQVGEKVKVKDLLKAMLVTSSNEAAYILANNHPQGFSAFVREMNLKAEELHLSSSFFTNPAGFDDLALQSTARDLEVLAREFLQHPQLAEITTLKESSITGTLDGQVINHYLINTNYLLHQDPRVVGVKTGTTDLAKEVLISLFNHQYQEQTYPILLVVMGSQDRYADTETLMNWIATHYHWVAVGDDFKLQ